MSTVFVHFESEKRDPKTGERNTWNHGWDEDDLDNLIAKQKKVDPTCKVIKIE